MNIPIPSILSSKKFWAALVATGVSFFAMRDGMSMQQIAAITGPLYMYIGAQGLADIGKERAKVENGDKPPTVG
jgi:hypothetical protein